MNTPRGIRRETCRGIRHRLRRGMTLIELIVGMVVTGAAVAAGYATFAVLVDQQQRAKMQVDDTAHGAALRRMLTGWIQDSYIMINTGGVPRNGLSLGSQGTRDEVRVFIQSGETPVFGQALMTMYVNTDNARVAPGLVAEFTTVANGGLDTTLVSIDPTIGGLRVEYLVENLDVRQWLTTEEIGQANLRPLAMRLWFLSNDPQFTSLLRIPLLIPLIQR